MASNIGIKVANGEFYPIMEENSLIKKRLILTTVHDNQPSVQIDLFRSAENTMTDAQYIGSLVVDNIKSKTKGEPSIEVVVSSNNEGEIVADAIDMDKSSKGEHSVLTVSLKSLDETARDMEIQDFELDAVEEKGEGLYKQAEKIRQRNKRPPLWLFIVIGLVIILGLLAVWLFLFGGMDTVFSGANRQSTAIVQQAPVDPVTAAPVQPAAEPAPVVQTPVQPAAIQPAAEPVPVIQAPVQQPEPQPQITGTRPPPPVASYNVPAVIPREGINYTIRWGDTLWDIAEAFYRNPFLYPRIAQFNNIRNPNYIISGRTIRIPPRD